MPTTPNETPNRPAARVWLLIAIAALVGTLALSFAWVAGWLSPERLTPARFTDAIEATSGGAFPGFRRAHAKGVCVSGWFEANGNGEALSFTRILAHGRTPFEGRMSIGGGSPYGLDAKARVRSMSLQLLDNNGDQWRMAMNSFPFFGSASAQDFFAQTQAARPDPTTGKPDPARQAAFVAAHPAAQRFAQWAKDARWSSSFANTSYYGVNTFRLIDAMGTVHHVRWTMQPQTPFTAMTADQRETADANYLVDELAARLAQGPLRWDMVVTLATADDDPSDPSTPWPSSRDQINVGTVVINGHSPQTTGACRDINFDPLILPPGVQGADDPILPARSAVYSTSFNRREREIARGAAGAAIGEPPAGEAR